MIIATVHEPPEAPVDPIDRAETLAFVSDRFSFKAAVLGPLWLLWRGLWLALLVYVVAVGAAAVVSLAAGLGPRWLALLAGAVHVIVGFEAASLERLKLERRGWRTLGTISGRSLAECEERFLRAWLPDQHVEHATPLPTPLSTPLSGQLSGLADGLSGDALGRRPARGWLPWRRRPA